MNLREIVSRLVARGIRPDTCSGHWRCAGCDVIEPHLHEVTVFKGTAVERQEWRDYGYDIRDQT